MPVPSGLHLWVLMDALGWSLVRDEPFLADLLPWRQPVRTVLGFSSAAIPTLLTGEWPSRHGHWNLFYYDPQGSPFGWLRWFRFLPRRLLDHRVTRRVVKELGRRVLGLGPLFECCVSPALLPYFNWAEKRDIFERRGVTGAPSLIDRLAEAGIPYQVYTYRQRDDAGILAQVEGDIRRGATGVFFVYLCEMDHFLHLYRGEPARWRERLRWYESGLREVFRAARAADPGATLVVFSDHGMTPVRARHDLIAEVEQTGCRQPSDYLAVYDSTMARFWFFSEGTRQKIAARLDSSPCGRILSDEELEQLGVHFEGGRFGEVIFLLHPGWMLTRSDFNGPRWNPAGIHGYHPADPDSDAVLLCDQPPAGPVRTIADVNRYLRERIGLPSGNGSAGVR